MAEHLIQDTTLTGIADKIRSLLGLTGRMSPAQMQTNLTTEQANITAALAALAEKGVTVPAGANSNALAGLIAAIESGGVFATGEVTLSESQQTLNITHDLGITPKVFCVFLSTEKTPANYGNVCVIYTSSLISGTDLYGVMAYKLSSGVNRFSINSSKGVVDAQSASFTHTNGTYTFESSKKYVWIAAG